MGPISVPYKNRNLLPLAESALRRDPSFTPHIYLMSEEAMDCNKFGIYLSQLVAASGTENDQSVRTVTILKRRTSTTPDFRFAIDEPAAKLYLSYGNDPAVTKLRIMDVQFDPADRLGYRRMRVQEQDRLFVVKVTPTAHAYLGPHIQVCPLTGKIFGHYTIQTNGRGIKYVMARFEEEIKAKNSVIRATLCDHKFVCASIYLVPYHYMFSKLNHLLVFYAFGEKQSLHYLCSYDNNLSLIECFTLYPAHLLGLRPSELIGGSLYILGHIHKYVLFDVDPSYILAVKWPKDWYTAKNLPIVQISRMIHLTDDIEVDDMKPMSQVALSKTQLFAILYNGDKPQQIRRMNLSPRFKDYRRCANCGEVEKRKRRNKNGKRVAKFKVCRLCKERNFHLFHLNPEIACHYCSDECQKKHWDAHKDIHKRSKLNRKTACAKQEENFFQQ